jgi:hypothetical protein
MGSRRDFLHKIFMILGVTSVSPRIKSLFAKQPAAAGLNAADTLSSENEKKGFNRPYSVTNLSRVDFPLGGIGAGMVCLEGTGAFSHVSLRNEPDIFNEPYLFAALCIKNKTGNTAKILEGPVPERKYFGNPKSGNGSGRTSYGFPRFKNAAFKRSFLLEKSTWKTISP